MFILLCVLSLWPVIIGWEHFLFEVLKYTALAGLVFILVLRVRRFSRARDNADG
jgi:large-conductance mechanosensitive channel